MDSGERLMRIEKIRIPYARDPGSCVTLSNSIRDEGLHRPITCWSDGTLVDGRRRMFAHMLLGRDRIPGVFVNNIEDAAKRMLADNLDAHHSKQWKWAEVCRLWEVLRRLDEPAAIQRADAAQRRGVELRRRTQAGQRKPGRSSGRVEDHFLHIVGEPFGISSATARRLDVIFHLGHGTLNAPDEKKALARELLDAIDAGTASIWNSYVRLTGGGGGGQSRPKVVAPIEPVSARQQLAAWDKVLPQLTGLTAGLVELGAPNADLTWDQVGPVHTQLAAIRRELEKMIRQMKEINKS